MAQPFILPRSQPEAQGISSYAITEFINSIEAHNLELHSFMLLRHGHVLAEGWWNPYEANLPHMLFSLSKSFTSTAIGLAVDEGILSLDDQVISFFPDDLPVEVSANLAAMQIRHLLMMGTGNGEDTMGALVQQAEGNWVKGFLSVPVGYTPGTHFLYNTGATYMLSAILQKVSNQTLLEYLEPRLLEPLNIRNATWAVCPRGINTGGFGMNITTEAIANFGQLYLQKGIWNGKRLLSEAWVEEATSKHISNGDSDANDWTQGYGYQFWRSRHNAYRGDGAFGQYCVVLPEQDVVIAITAGLGDMQIVLNEVWDILLPALKSEALAKDEPAAALLQSLLNNLKLDPPQLQLLSVRETAINGREYSLEVNEDKYEKFSIRFEANEATAVFTMSYGDNIFQLGRGAWLPSKIQVSDVENGHNIASRISSSFTWQDDNTLVLVIRYIEMPFYQTIICRFEGEELVLEKTVNVSFGPKETAPIKGKQLNG
ncbi:class C beta-lactamase-related serine hydrolase [Paenibacillus psychroresistens]|uniref:Class C beta-lactamase-related serine hydrolase n=1 Tax=Paenibacillus psychroresistens TaxID=1778678 RepID=A0A6B8RUW4_9BACL|nr:serine hydrolase [Paenibacillus psychroresistens]QGQ99425.1 class C beta-lactamase-related serine hydrolase [Paenibacillus psychroresistens]